MQQEAQEVIEEEANTVPFKHPSPFATPVTAMALAAIIGVSAVYADYARGTLFDALDKDYRVNDFEQLINNSTLKESFSAGEWEYTIIAPTDQAFDKAQWKKRQDENPSQEKDPVLDTISAYDYITATPVYPEDIKFGKHIRISSLNGQNLIFSRIQSGITGLRINGQPVNSVHYADNGVIYIIDDMIAFPEFGHQLSWKR